MELTQMLTKFSLSENFKKLNYEGFRDVQALLHKFKDFQVKFGTNPEKDVMYSQMNYPIPQIDRDIFKLLLSDTAMYIPGNMKRLPTTRFVALHAST